MAKLKPIFLVLLGLVSFARSASLVTAPARTPERLLSDICTIAASNAGETGFWNTLLAEISPEVKSAISKISIENQCADLKKAIVVLDIMTIKTQIDLLLLESVPEKSPDGSEFKFHCYMIDSKFGQNDFSKTMCLEVMDEETAKNDFFTKIKHDLIGVLQYIVARINDSLTVDKVSNFLAKYLKEEFEVGKTDQKLYLSIQAACPHMDNSPYRFTVENQQKIEISGKSAYRLTFLCSGVSVSYFVDIFQPNHDIIIVRFSTSSSSFEINWEVNSLDRIDKIEASNGQLKTENLIADEFKELYQKDLEIFLNSGLSLSTGDKERLIESSVSFPSFVSLVDKALLLTPEREKFVANQRLIHVTRLNMEHIKRRPEIHNIEDSSDDEVPPADGPQEERRTFNTFKPFDYFFYISRDPVTGTIDFGKFFGEINTKSMQVGIETTYCKFLEMSDCRAGGDYPVDGLEDQANKYKEYLLKRANIYPTDDKTIAEFMETNSYDYAPIELVYGLDEIYRLLLVKAWEINTAIFQGAVLQFKTQFFFVEYIIPFIDEQSMYKLVVSLSDNVLDHYSQTVLDSHSQTSKATDFTVDILKKQVGVALFKVKIVDHVCFYQSDLISRGSHWHLLRLRPGAGQARQGGRHDRGVRDHRVCPDESSRPNQGL